MGNHKGDGVDNLKIGAVIPTMGNRQLFLDFVIDRIKPQVNELLIINRKPAPDRIDIAEKYIEGINRLIQMGCDLIFLIEDDDYYPLSYIESMVNEWINQGKPTILGLKNTVYYHIISRNYRYFENKKHCAAFTTMVTKGINLNFSHKKDNPCFDVELWKHNTGKLASIDSMPVGIKHGIGISGGRFHSHSNSNYKEIDQNFTIFEKIFDSEAKEFYKKYFIQ